MNSPDTYKHTRTNENLYTFIQSNVQTILLSDFCLFVFPPFLFNPSAFISWPIHRKFLAFGFFLVMKNKQIISIENHWTIFFEWLCSVRVQNWTMNFYFKKKLKMNPFCHWMLPDTVEMHLYLHLPLAKKDKNQIFIYRWRLCKKKGVREEPLSLSHIDKWRTTCLFNQSVSNWSSWLRRWI